MALTRIFYIALCVISTKLQETPAKTNLKKCTDFSKIASTPEFVDKSLLIKDFFSHNQNFSLITMPRLFGKSVNMDMIRRFFEPTMNQEEQILSSDEQGGVNQNLFETSDGKVSENFKLFQNLKIYNDSLFFYENFGQHPILYLNFGSVTGTTVRELWDSFKSLISQVFRQHVYLLNRRNLWTDGNGTFNKSTFEEYITMGQDEDLNNTIVFVNSLRFLSELMSQNYKKRIVVLIDELDTPILKLLPHPQDLFPPFIRFVADTLSQLLVYNSNIRKALCHASTDFGMVLLKDVNTFVHFPFLKNHTYSRYYGLTEDEVHTLANVFKNSNLQEIEKWYGGYTIAGTFTKMYNIYSVVNYFTVGVVESFWVNTVGISLKSELRSVYLRLHLERLVKNTEVCIMTEHFMKFKKTLRNFEQLLYLRLFMHNTPEIFDSTDSSEVDIWIFLRYLYNLGYLSITHVRLDVDDICFEIPNFEAGLHLSNQLYNLQFYAKKFNFSMESVHLYKQALNSLGGKDTFETFAKSIITLFSPPEHWFMVAPVPEDSIELHKFLLLCTRNFENSTIFQRVYGKIYNGKESMENLVILVLRKDGTAILLQANYEDLTSYESLIRIMDTNLHIVDQYKEHIKERIYMGISLEQDEDENMQISLSYLINTNDIKQAVNVTM